MAPIPNSLKAKAEWPQRPIQLKQRQNGSSYICYQSEPI